MQLIKDFSEETWEVFRDVFEETSLNSLPGEVSEICKSALFEMSLRRAVSDV